MSKILDGLRARGSKMYQQVVTTTVPAAKGNGKFSAQDYKDMPILKNDAAQARLVRHIMLRMLWAKTERDERWERCAAIDIQLSGFTKLDKDDRKRFRDILLKGKVKPTDHNLPLAEAQLDDANAYLMSIFAPDMNLFESAAPAEKAEQSKALTQEINDQGQKAQYFRHITKLCQCGLRYNFGAITCYWEKQMGYVFEGSQTGAGTLTKKVGIVWQGNAIKTVDVYNFFYDFSKHIADLPTQGEWFAEVEAITGFNACKDEEDKKEYGVWRFYNYEANTVTGVMNGFSFYRAPPEVRQFDGTTIGARQTNWVNLLREGGETPEGPSVGIERVRWTGWIRPKEYGLGPSDDLELWRIHIMQGNYVTFAQKLDNTHGMLPIAGVAPIEDDLRDQQRTFAERLLPMQHFQSFLMNSHQAGVRKSLYGVTVYNQNLFPGLDLSKEDLTSATIAMRGSSMGVDIDKAFRHYNTAPSTESNIDMIAKVDQIMQKILPTDLYRQVADLERATLYQAAATVQTGNRRSLKIARMISSQCMEILKLQMVYNIYANQPPIDYTDKEGQTKVLSPAEFVDLGLEKYISNGLKGIDRLMIITAFKEVLAMVLQSQQAIQQLDIVSLLAYFFNLVGEPVDLNSFRLTAEQQQQNAINNGQIAPPQPGAVPAPAPAA